MKKIRVIAGLLLCAAMFGGCAGHEGGQEGNPAEMETAMEEIAEEADAGREGEADAASKEGQDESLAQAQAKLPDGIYMAEFHTDSGMFHVSEACEGKGTLTVENGEMWIHISLGSKKILNLYPGLAQDAEKEGAKLLLPTEDTVTYSDGMTEEVYGFDVPVPVLEDEFDLALIGTKGKWYDHKVSVSNPMPLEDETSEGSPKAGEGKNAETAAGLADGTYTVELTFEGGSGKAEILSPASICVTDGKAVATVQWSSPNYDYMIVDGEKYLPLSTEGGSIFEIPVLAFDEPMDVIGDTLAMSKPHEVEYRITFLLDTVK